MEAISFDVWSILFLIAAVQGLFLSAMIFARKLSANHFLAWLISSFSAMLLYYVTYWTRLETILPPYLGLAQGFTLFLGPLFYFYLKSKTKNIYFNGWHFLPFLIYAFNFFLVPHLSSPLNFRLQLLQIILQIAHLSFYCSRSFYILKDAGHLNNGALKRWRWQKKIALAFAGYVFSFITYYILVWTGLINIEYDYMISGASTFFIYFIGYNGFQKPQLLKMHEVPRYDKSSLSSGASDVILRELKQYFENELPYLESSLKQADLTHRLKYSVHQISQAINEQEGKSFSDFVNEYRVEKAKTLLVDKRSMKIIHVAYDCGFNNKASFNNAFKKLTGISPSRYREIQAISLELN